MKLGIGIKVLALAIDRDHNICNYNLVAGGINAKERQFDEPHPGKELYTYQVKAVIDFLKEVGEI